MKISALGITLTSLPALLFFLSEETIPLTTALILLLPLSAMLTILASYSHHTSTTDLFTLLLLLILGLGFMISPGTTGLLSLGSVFIVLIFMLLRQKNRSRFSVLWGIGLYGFALGALLSSLVLSPPAAPILLLLVYAILLPTCPLHGASIVSSSRLCGIYPNFLALFLPALGLRGAFTILAGLPPAVLSLVSVFALIGAVYGSIRALVQNNIRHRLAYAALTFWSILWWYLANTGTESAPAILYFCALALIIQGLFIAGYVLEKRQGELNLDQLGGLARPMPRFGILLSLLVAAGMGLPLFGSFTALVAMSTFPSITLFGGFGVVLLAWLTGSWHFPIFMQNILLGPPQTGRIYRDLVTSELLSLCLIIMMIVMLGLAPQTVIGLDPGSGQTPPVQEANSRKK